MFFDLAGIVRRPLSMAGLVVLGIFLVGVVAGPALVPFDPRHVGTGPRLAPPGPPFWLGTDALGRDVLSRAIVGTRITLIVGFASAALATVLGVLVGGLAGYLGGPLDAVLSRLTELVMVIPAFFLAVLFVALFGQAEVNIVLTIGLLSWPIIARIARVEFASLKRRGYVDAARVAGAGALEVLVREILPNAMGPIAVAATLQAGAAMLLEAGLSYLGLGDPGQPSLGLQLQESQLVMTIAWWTAVCPGALLFSAVLATNLLGDGISAMFDPREAAG